MCWRKVVKSGAQTPPTQCGQRELPVLSKQRPGKELRGCVSGSPVLSIVIHYNETHNTKLLLLFNKWQVCVFVHRSVSRVSAQHSPRRKAPLGVTVKSVK